MAEKESPDKPAFLRLLVADRGGQTVEQTVQRNSTLALLPFGQQVM